MKGLSVCCYIWAVCAQMENIPPDRSVYSISQMNIVADTQAASLGS